MTGSSAFPWNQARFDAGELITQRELVSRQVSDDLTERAATFGLILDDVSLVRVLGSLRGGGGGAWLRFWVDTVRSYLALSLMKTGKQ